jgi:RES domain-containing protein
VTPLPSSRGGGSGPLVAWRLCETRYANTWDDGEGSFRNGGRWNSEGVRAVYCSLDPATAILEVAVHVGFDTLDTVPHTLTKLEIADSTRVHVVEPSAIPNENWLGLGDPSAGQQRFGNNLLRKNDFIVIPSAVAPHSWNLMFERGRAEGHYKLLTQERFALDTRLNPPISITYR